MYKKGQVLEYHFPERRLKRISKTNVIKDHHRVVVLHARETPYKTILIAPITTAKSLQDADQVPSNYLKILKDDYPLILEHDSFINLDMIHVVDAKELDKFERYNKKIECVLNRGDMVQLDYKITLTYELGRYIKDEILAKEMKNVVEYIDTEIKDALVKITSGLELDKINEILNVLDILTNSIKSTYTDKKK